MSNERREPKGIPTGGRFAPNGTGGSATDLEHGTQTIRGDETIEDLMPDWPAADGRAERSYHTADGNTLTVTRVRTTVELNRNGIFPDGREPYDPYTETKWDETVAYDTPAGSVRIRDLQYNEDPRPEPRPIAWTTRLMDKYIERAHHALRDYTGFRPDRVTMTPNPDPKRPVEVNGEWSHEPEPEGFHPVRRARARRANRRMDESHWLIVELNADGTTSATRIRRIPER